MEGEGYIKELLTKFTNASADAIAFSIYDGKNVTNISYSQFAQDILKAAGFFVWKDIQKQHIALLSPNSYEWIVTFFAIIASGNIAVLMNQDLPSHTLQQQCKKADVTIVCGEESFVSPLSAQWENMTAIPFRTVMAGPAITFDAIYEEMPDETIIMMFTSGTTGESKIVEITSLNVKYSLKNLDPSYALKGMERLFTPIPFYHIAGLTTVLEALKEGKTECIGRGIKYIFMDMPVLAPTTINAVPSIVESLLKLLRKNPSPDAVQKYVGKNFQLICASGAVLKPSVSSFIRSLGIDVVVYYGMSEVTGAATWTMLDEKHLSATGKFCEYTEYCFRDGELLLKGPTLMKGYYKDPEETAKVIGEGWIHTGDVGYCSEDGYLYLIGRKKNVIILSNGENVNPEEIEAKFYECKAILECMVYSDGKGICADVYSEDEKIASEYIRKHNEDLPIYRQVYKVNYSATPLEKTGSGKIKRKENL